MIQLSQDFISGLFEHPWSSGEGTGRAGFDSWCHPVTLANSPRPCVLCWLSAAGKDPPGWGEGLLEPQ